MKLAAVVAFVGAQGARVGRKKLEESGAPEAGDNFIVLFKDGTTDADIQEFCAGRCGVVGHPSSGGVAFAQVRGGSDGEMRAMAHANADKVELYEPDPLDYMIPELSNSEATSTASWGLERTGVPTRGFTGKGQTIYVQDTGVRFTHSDFGGRAFAGFDLTNGEPEVCDKGSLTCALDREGHGTHCAGTAAGTTFGVASEASVVAVKSLGDRGSGERSWQIAGIDWVTTSGVKPSILSMSLGGRGTDAVFEKAIGMATAAGVTVVVAAGNAGMSSCFASPAFVADAITVGSTTSTNRRSGFSNYGDCNNIMAPGSDIISADGRSDDGARSISGTSMACPHVSGAAALLLEEDPSLNRDQILNKLLEVSRKNFIGSLKREDPAEFLWVGAEAAPDEPPIQVECPLRCRIFGCDANICQENCFRCCIRCKPWTN